MSVEGLKGIVFLLFFMGCAPEVEREEVKLLHCFDSYADLQKEYEDLCIDSVEIFGEPTFLFSPGLNVTPNCPMFNSLDSTCGKYKDWGLLS